MAKKKDIAVEGLEETVAGEAIREDDDIDREKSSQQSEDDQQVDLESAEHETETEEETPSEVNAVRTDNETARELNKSEIQGKKAPSKKVPALAKSKAKAKKIRSVKYKKASERIDRDRKYQVKEAIKLVKETSYSGFDGTIEIAVKVQKPKKKGAQENVRGIVKLPSGTAKKKNVIIFNEDLVEKIKKGWADFDVLVATPADMPKLAPLAKILGPKGKMPNPKSSTVTDNPKEAVEELSGQSIEYKIDAASNIHIPIAKISWDEEKILANYQVVMRALARLKILNATLSATRGPGVKVDIAKK